MVAITATVRVNPDFRGASSGFPAAGLNKITGPCGRPVMPIRAVTRERACHGKYIFAAVRWPSALLASDGMKKRHEKQMMMATVMMVVMTTSYVGTIGCYCRCSRGSVSGVVGVIHGGGIWMLSCMCNSKRVGSTP